MTRAGNGGGARPTATRPAAAPDFELGELDLYLFKEGTHARLYEKMGAHLAEKDGVKGAHFAVWAPNAAAVSVIGDFNGWAEGSSPLSCPDDSGIFRGFIADVASGARYKFHLRSNVRDYCVAKADPFGLRHEVPPGTASVVCAPSYEWGDGEWLAKRQKSRPGREPMSIYEVHLGSFRRGPDGAMPGYRELATTLTEHVKRLGFTHVELMPVTEHPFYGSWGYETTGYFAASSRYGSPEELMQLIDALHREGIGVILDWVPAHFPTDEHGLAYFDGTHLFEHENPQQGFHPDWKTAIFNYGRHEVRSFLLSSAHFWIDRFHIDGLRVDGVASMLYLDYGRNEGEWVPNEDGGKENLAAIAFLRQLNKGISNTQPSVVTIAEESTSWPRVTGAVEHGGLGFSTKWDMGWMHDALEYFGRDPIARSHHHRSLTFRGLYAWSEAFVLPLSHDEVVHGKGSLYQKMAGDHGQKLANLRLLFASMYAQPGKKLLFMGSELALQGEWNHDAGLDWSARERAAGLELLVGELNKLYRNEPSLHVLDNDASGFAWVEANDNERSITAFIRRAEDVRDTILVVLNHTPVVRENYRIGVPSGGPWEEVLNTDAATFGGQGFGNLGLVEAAPIRSHERAWSLTLQLPPLAAVFLKPRPAASTPAQRLL